MALADQRNAVDTALDESPDLPRLLRLVVVAGCDQKLVTEFLQPSLQRRDARSEDADPERRYDIADGEGMARSQRSRSSVPDITELVHRAHDTVANLWAHLCRMIEDARNRGGGDTSPPSHIAESRHGSNHSDQHRKAPPPLASAGVSDRQRIVKERSPGSTHASTPSPRPAPRGSSK